MSKLSNNEDAFDHDQARGPTACFENIRHYIRNLNVCQKFTGYFKGAIFFLWQLATDKNNILPRFRQYTFKYNHGTYYF